MLNTTVLQDSPEGAPSATSSTEATRPGWLTKDRVEMAFVVITLVSMLAGLLVSTQNLGPAWLPTLCFGIAYFTGGIFGLQ